MEREKTLEERLLLEKRNKLVDLSSELLDKVTESIKKYDLSINDILKINELSLYTFVANKKYHQAYACLVTEPCLSPELLEEISSYKVIEEEIDKRIETANERIMHIRESLKQRTGEYKLQITDEWEFSIYKEGIDAIIEALERKKSRLSSKEIYDIRKKVFVSNIMSPKIDHLDSEDKKILESSEIIETKENENSDINIAYI